MGQINYTFYFYDDFTWKWYKLSPSIPEYEGIWKMEDDVIKAHWIHEQYGEIDFGECTIVDGGILHNNNFYKKLK